MEFFVPKTIDADQTQEQGFRGKLTRPLVDCSFADHKEQTGVEQ